MINFSPEIAALNEELVALRRDFHRHPELGFQEVRTSKIVEDYLKDLGLEVRRCAGTGVIGVLRGAKPGKTLLLRCDIDALPMKEESGVEFSSAEGWENAENIKCGNAGEEKDRSECRHGRTGERGQIHDEQKQCGEGCGTGGDACRYPFGQRRGRGRIFLFCNQGEADAG